MERLTNSIDRKTMFTVILLTLPFYCLGIFAWSISPTTQSDQPTADGLIISTETEEFTLTPEPTDILLNISLTPNPTKTSTATITKTITPTVTATRTATVTGTSTATQTATVTPLPTATATIQPTATEQIFEFFTPTNLPDDILTIMP